MSIYKGTELLAGVATNTVSNAHSLFDFIWSDHIKNEMSWVNANYFSWLDGSLYVAAYNHILADYNGGTSQTETVGSYTITYVLADDGHKITTDETNVANIYNESGVAWYYILDTANQRFKLPRENPAREELIQVIRAKGNGISLGLTNGTTTAGLQGSAYADNYAIGVYTNSYGINVGSNTSATTNIISGSLGITTDPAKSGIISSMTDSTSVYKGKKYLYFYVGQFSQSATEQTAGLNSELFNGKVDLDGNNATFPHIVETYKSGTEWYRIYSDGWCEQGGIAVQGSGGNVSVNLLKQFANTDYITVSNLNSTGGTGSYNPVVCVSKTTSTFQLATWGDGTAGYNLGWKAVGYIS